MAGGIAGLAAATSRRRGGERKAMSEGPSDTSASYYAAKLSGERLRRCYELASPRVRQYLDAEISFVLSRLTDADDVLELGCGYGRVARELARVAKRVVGIDTSLRSLELARALEDPSRDCTYLQMDASEMTFDDAEFDAVVCVQNGICAFRVDSAALLLGALRVLRPGGRALVSTYAREFWPERLDWFRAQAEAGLVGEIDEEASGDGTIVCKDGLRLGMLSVEDLVALGKTVGVRPEIEEIDGSSVFGIWVR